MSEEIRDAVEVLVEKMKSEPYAFVQGGRFAWVSAQLTSQEELLASMINPSELSALKEAFREVRYTMFRERVFNCLLGDPEPEIKDIENLRANFGWVDPLKLLGTTTSSQVAIAKQLLKKTVK